MSYKASQINNVYSYYCYYYYFKKEEERQAAAVHLTFQVKASLPYKSSSWAAIHTFQVIAHKNIHVATLYV